MFSGFSRSPSLEGLQTAGLRDGGTERSGSVNGRAIVKTLVAWIGRQDIDGAAHSPPRGPIIDFLRVHEGVEPDLLSDWPRRETAPYVEMLERNGFPKDIREVSLKDPTDYLPIYRIADALLAELSKKVSPKEIAVHTSPGTPSMAAVWVLLGKTKYAGVRLFKSWIDRATGKPNLAEVDIPFDLTLDVLPDLTARHAKLLAPLSSDELPPTTAFEPWSLTSLSKKAQAKYFAQFICRI
jgi:hypothetical protein